MSLCGAIPRVILAGLHSWTPRGCFTFWKVPGTNKARVKSTFALCVCVCVSHCRVWLSATPWTVAHQAPPISQARIPEWGAISFSRASSQPRDQTQVTCTAGRFSTTELLGKPRLCLTILKAWLISSKPRPDDFIIVDQTSFTIFHKIMPSHPQINLSMTSKLLYFVDTHHTHTHTHIHTEPHSWNQYHKSSFRHKKYCMAHGSLLQITLPHILYPHYGSPPNFYNFSILIY